MFSQYVLILAWVGFAAFVLNGIKSTQKETVCGEDVTRVRWIYALLVFVPIILMAGFRCNDQVVMWSTDTGMYKSKFFKMPNSFSGIIPYTLKVKKDRGFSFISAIIHVILGNDKIDLYFLIIAAFQGLSLVNLFRKYSTSYITSVFLFVASADYISWMYNGLRQFMATTIMLFATPLFLKKSRDPFRKYLPIVAIILIASTMHRSALLMLPIVFIAQGKAWNKKTLVFILVVMLVIVFVGQFTSWLDDSLQDSQYENVVTESKKMNDDGTNPLRVLVYSLPAIISFFGRKKINDEGGAVINFCTNMSIISAGLYFVSMFTSGIFLGRLPIYCSLYGYILLPWELKNIFKKFSLQLTTGIMVIAYLGYYVYQMHFSWEYF